MILIEAADKVSFIMVKTKLAVHRIAQIKELAANQYKPSRVDINRRGFNTAERNARGRRKRDDLAIPYASEPDSEPEPEPEDIIQDEPEPEAIIQDKPEDDAMGEVSNPKGPV